MLAHFGHHVVTALPVPLLPYIRSEFDLDYTQSGLLISSFTLSYGLSQLPAGWLVARVGPRLLISIGISGVALAGLLLGLSQTYMMMVFSMVFMGVLGGGYHPAAPPLVSKTVEPRNLGMALGFHVIGGTASYFLSPLIGVAIAIIWGWRGSFIALSVPLIAFGIVFYALFGRQGKGGKRHGTPDRRDGTAVAPGRLRRLVAFIVLSTSTQAVVLSTIAFIPLFVVDISGVSKEKGAALLAVVYFSGLWASPLGGYLSDRLGRIPVMLVVTTISGPFIYLLNLVPYGLGFGVLLLTIGMITSMRLPVIEAYIVGETPERHRSMVLGIYYFSGVEAGGLLTPVMGSLIDRFGFYPSFALAGGVLVAMPLICSVWLLGGRD